LFGLSVPRFATQRVGLAWSALALLLVWGAQRGQGRRWPAGGLGAYALSLVALGAFGLGFTRGDPTPLIAGYRADVVGSALVLLGATLVWSMAILRSTARAAAPHPAEPPAPPASGPEAPPSPEPPDSPEAHQAPYSP
jgi:hypothetical protein